MKILFIHTKYLHSAGGEDTTVEAEIGLMRSKGHDVRLLLFDNAEMGKGLPGKVQAGISSVYNRSSAKKLRKAIGEFNPDLIHVHNFFFAASPSVIIQACRSHVPVVVTLHNFRLVCPNSLLLRNNKVCELCLPHAFPWYGVKYKCYHHSSIESAMVGGMSAIHNRIGTWRRKVDMFISPAAFSRQKILSSSLHLLPEKVRVKHNFLDDPGTGNPAHRENYYLFVGRLSPEKGLQTLLDAWSRLPEERLVIVGDGPEYASMTREYSHAGNITFTGRKPRAEVLGLMKKTKALLFPSLCYEGLPLTIVEAFATGTPVIGSALGAMKEMIIHGYNGLLFEAGNATQLADAVMTFSHGVQDTGHMLYANARSSYEKNYHPEKCYEDTMEIYQLAIQSRRQNNQGL